MEHCGLDLDWAGVLVLMFTLGLQIYALNGSPFTWGYCFNSLVIKKGKDTPIYFLVFLILLFQMLLRFWSPDESNIIKYNERDDLCTTRKSGPELLRKDLWQGFWLTESFDSFLLIWLHVSLAWWVICLFIWFFNEKWY